MGLGGTAAPAGRGSVMVGDTRCVFVSNTVMTPLFSAVTNPVAPSSVKTTVARPRAGRDPRDFLQRRRVDGDDGVAPF